MHTKIVFGELPAIEITQDSLSEVFARVISIPFNLTDAEAILKIADGIR